MQAETQCSLDRKSNEEKLTNSGLDTIANQKLVFSERICRDFEAEIDSSYLLSTRYEVRNFTAIYDYDQGYTDNDDGRILFRGSLERN